MTTPIPPPANIFPTVHPGGKVTPGNSRGLPPGIPGWAVGLPIGVLKGLFPGLSWGQATSAGSGVTKAGVATVDAATATGRFLSKLGQRETWLRIAEGGLGVGLIVVGVIALTHGTAVAKKVIGNTPVGKTASKIGVLK